MPRIMWKGLFANMTTVLITVSILVWFTSGSGTSQKAEKQFKSVIKANANDIYRIKSISDYLAS